MHLPFVWAIPRLSVLLITEV